MGSAHHGAEPERPAPAQEALMKRLMEQIEGRAKRAYSEGRMNAVDDGDLAFAVAADPEHKVIRIDFGKPVTWLAMGEKQTKGLIQLLIGKLREIATEPFTLEV